MYTDIGQPEGNQKFDKSMIDISEFSTKEKTKFPKYLS